MRSPNGFPAQEFDRLYAIESDDCVLWTCGKISTGYGMLMYEGERHLAHRLSCQKKHGDPLPEQTDAAHSCRERSCMNPRHLRWATRSENNMDKVRDGTHDRGERSHLSRLSEDQVRELRSLRESGVSVRDIADKFGVHVQTVYSVLSGASWAWLS